MNKTSIRLRSTCIACFLILALILSGCDQAALSTTAERATPGSSSSKKASPGRTAGADNATPVSTTKASPGRTASARKTSTPKGSVTSGEAGAFFLNRTDATDSASTAVDAAGGIHLAFATYTADASGRRTGYYAYCSADCGQEQNWATVSFSDDVAEVQLALTSDGHPRLLLRGDQPVSPFDSQYLYAACDSNCTDGANWTVVGVATSDYSSAFDEDYPAHYFCLDQQDRPRFLYRNDNYAAFLVFCDTGCSDAVNWYKFPVSKDIFNGTSFPVLAFTSLGQPRIATTISSGEPDYELYLAYDACDANCGDPANWTYTPLMKVGYGHSSSSMKLTSDDQPRIVFNQGSDSAGDAGYLYYLWCNGDCSNADNWSGSSVGNPGQAEDPDLALDAAGNPRIAFKSTSPNEGLGYFWCDSNCESTSGDWMVKLLESSSVLDTEWDILPPLNCSGSYWYGGYRPSLALDAAGNPRIGYVAQHLHGGGSSCSVSEDFRAVRFIYINTP